MKMTAVAPLQRAYPRAILASLLFLFALPALIWWLGVRLLDLRAGAQAGDFTLSPRDGAAPGAPAAQGHRVIDTDLLAIL